MPTIASASPYPTSQTASVNLSPATAVSVAVKRSAIIPVYNGSATIEFVVEGLLDPATTVASEIVLVNDGSQDDSERVCRKLAARYPQHVTYVHLSRNLGEHAAVTVGFRYCRGDYVAVVDDDGQHPPAEVNRLFAAAESGGYDVVYGRFIERKHSFLRRTFSRLHNSAACWMLDKPRDLYLSSLKVVNRRVAERIAAYDGPFPYVDGVVLGAAHRLTQVDVLHLPRRAGRSQYTFGKLLRLWRTAFLGWSTVAFRAALGLVAILSACGLLVVSYRTSGNGESSTQHVLVVGWLLGTTLLPVALLVAHRRGTAAAKTHLRSDLVQYVLCGAAQHA